VTHRRSVLVVAYDFPPHGAVGTMRTLRLVRHLDRRGWNVSVLTGDPETYLPGTPIDQDLVERVPDAVKVLYARAWRRVRPIAPAVTQPSASKPASVPRKHRWPPLVVRAKAYLDTVTGIPDRENAWLAPAVLAGLRSHRANPPDLIYSSAPPWTGQLVACALAARLRRPWIADFRDPWARLPWRENRPYFVRRAAATFEDMAVRKAAAVIFTTQGILRDVAAHHDQRFAQKFHVVANGCDLAEFEGIQPAGSDGRFVLLHAGSLYGGRDPRPLMRAIATAIRQGLIDRRRFRLRLIGTVVLDGVDLRAASEEFGLQDVVELISRMPRRQSLIEMVSASALLLIQPGHPLSVPAKAFEYLATGRPILAIADEGETADLVRQSQAGIVVSAADPQRMIEALVQLIHQPDTLRPANREWFDGEHRASEVADLFDVVLASAQTKQLPEEFGVEPRGIAHKGPTDA
jgi:glycosyltransferase involved in cell wall biosynthesis